MPKSAVSCQHLTRVTSFMPLNSLWVLHNTLSPHLISLRQGLKKMTFLKMKHYMDHSCQVPREGRLQPNTHSAHKDKKSALRTQRGRVRVLWTPSTNEWPGRDLTSHSKVQGRFLDTPLPDTPPNHHTTAWPKSVETLKTTAGIWVSLRPRSCLEWRRAALRPITKSVPMLKSIQGARWTRVWEDGRIDLE